MATRVEDQMVPRFVSVGDTWDETYDTFTLALNPGGAGFAFRPGQFNMLYVFGIGEVPISISGHPDRPEALTHTVRGVGAVTTALRRLLPGQQIGIRGPYGAPWPVGQAAGHDVVFVGGGIGLAPLRPAIYHVLERREQYGRVVLVYGARTSSDLLYQDELMQWRGRFDLDVAVTVDTADRSWRGSVGVVTNLIPRAPFDPDDAVAFVCGPQVMMTFAGEALERRGVRASRIHLSMERNMKCGIGLCGHCQFGGDFICREGPVFTLEETRRRLEIREL